MRYVADGRAVSRAQMRQASNRQPAEADALDLRSRRHDGHYERMSRHTTGPFDLNLLAAALYQASAEDQALIRADLRRPDNRLSPLDYFKLMVTDGHGGMGDAPIDHAWGRLINHLLAIRAERETATFQSSLDQQTAALEAALAPATPVPEAIAAPEVGPTLPEPETVAAPEVVKPPEMVERPVYRDRPGPHGYDDSESLMQMRKSVRSKKAPSVWAAAKMIAGSTNTDGTENKTALNRLVRKYKLWEVDKFPTEWVTPE
jgi:hypothetical protein